MGGSSGGKRMRGEGRNGMNEQLEGQVRMPQGYASSQPAMPTACAVW